MISQDYLAVDYSPEMVEAFVALNPGVAVRVGDARRLDDLPALSFALILFSNNGIDAVDHRDRLLVLRRFADLLAPDGALVFSTLALDGPSFRETPWHQHRRGVPDPGPRGWVSRGADVARRVRHLPAARHNWRLTRRRTERGTEWATAPLAAHDFSIVAHFETASRLAAELAEAGLRPVGCYAEDGRPLDLGNDHGGTSRVDGSGVDCFSVVAVLDRADV